MNLRSAITRCGWGLVAPLLLILLAACTPVTLEGTSTTPAATAPTAAPTEESAAESDTASDMASAAIGIYKGFFPGASSPGLDMTLYLNFDGTLQVVSDYLNGEAPIVEVGEWTAQDEAVVLTITGQPDQAYATPSTHTLTLVADQLVATDWIGPWYRFDALAMGMSPAYDTAMATEMFAADGVVGFYKRFAPSASCCGQDITLLLAVDNTVRLETNYLNGEPSIVEIGTWEDTGEGLVSVSLTGREDGTDYEAPVEFVFETVEGMLSAAEYDVTRYGESGLSFYLLPALAMAGLQAAGLVDAAGDATAESIDLVGTRWQLQEILMMDDSLLTPANPADYTLEFNADSTVAFQADCNRGTGPYTLNPPQLTMGPLAVNAAMCGPESISDRYVQGLNSADSFVMDGDNLAIAFGFDSGIMIFNPVTE